MTEPDFVDKVRDKLRDIAIKERDLESQLGQLQQERVQYQAAMDVWSREMGNGSKPAVTPRTDTFQDKELQGMTVAKASEFLMERFGGSVKVADLARMLRAAGITKSKGTGAYSTVLKTLQRNPEVFYQVETGKWGLMRERPPAISNL